MGLELNLSDRCNLACPFCYTRGGGGKDANWKRTESILKWYFDEHPYATGSISVFGGEPLLEWNHLTKLIEWTKGRTVGGKRISVGIVTNMTLLTAKKLEYLSHHNVRISPSIDGCEAAQNAGRIYTDGRGSADRVYANARRYRVRRPKSSNTVRATFSPETVCNLAESVRFLNEDIGFRTVNAVHAGGTDWTRAALAEYDKQLALVTDWYIERVKSNPRHLPDLYHVRNYINAMRKKEIGQRVSICKVGSGRVAVDTSGNIWPCHRFANPNSTDFWKLGTIETGVTNTELVKAIEEYKPIEQTLDAENKCATCPVRDICYAHCWWEVMASGKAELRDGKLFVHPGETFCHIWRGIMREGARAVAALGKAGIDVMRTNQKSKRADGICYACDEGPCKHCDQGRCVTTDNPVIKRQVSCKHSVR